MDDLAVVFRSLKGQ